MSNTRKEDKVGGAVTLIRGIDPWLATEMASKARLAFDKNCEDVDRLLEVHVSLTGTAPGRRRQVEVLNKAGVVLITAFWEAYCEDIAAEGARHLVKHAKSANDLPEHLKKLVAKELSDQKHDLAAWQLADNGWRTFIEARLASIEAERNRRLNTPKTSQIDELFARSLGIEQMSKSWAWPRNPATKTAAKLDAFVTLRGSVAHRGTAAGGVKKKDVVDYYTLVKKLVSLTGGKVNGSVRKSTGKPLWEPRKRASTVPAT
ncbi:HEPN domain-containing protein [Nocardia sp. NPDC058518]|uniref:HEPN domain-containing protein n=1 Tax=Nocardia sp. NPDC058518 TaxID=3346534 RepID=UPI00364BDF7F